MANKRALGKGLGALISDHFEEEIVVNDNNLQEIDINAITPNALQPRKHFAADAIDSLAESIARNGIIQPLLLHEVKNGYEIIAGERRWRAARQAGLKAVPAIVMNPDEQKLYEVSLIENMQREDLNPIEEALAFQSLISSFNMAQREVASVVGKSRSYVTNALRLLQLPEQLQQMIIDGKLTAGHAKVLVGLDQNRQLAVAEQIVSKQLSVRQVEQLINQTKRRKSAAKPSQNIFYRDAAKQLEQQLGSRVKITGRAGKGHIVIDFYSEDDLARIIDIIN